MKILGLHWAAHAVYLMTLFAGIYFGQNKIKEAVFLKKEIGQVQKFSLPVVRIANQWPLLREIQKNADSYRTPKNEANAQSANHAENLVAAFTKKCETVQQQLNTGTKPVQIDWSKDLLTDYYLLGDSLKIILPQNENGQDWLDRCLFSDYRACQPQQLASWLICSDTGEIRTIIQNLNLKAELALYSGLTTLHKQMTKAFDLSFNAMLPVITYTNCPRVGEPFEAEISLLPYCTTAQNVKAKINGQYVPIKNGLVHYETTLPASGQPKLNVQFFVINPLTGETRAYTREM